MRKKLKLNQNWQFLGPDGGVQTLDLPHTWNARDGQDGGNDYWRGSCTYKKQFPRPDFDPDRQDVYLEFCGVNASAWVELNGEQVMTHDGGYSTFRVCGTLPGRMRPEQAGLGTAWDQELSWTPLDAAAARRALADQQQDLALVMEGEPFPQDPWDSRVLWQDRIQLALPVCRKGLPLSPDLAGLCYVTSAGTDSLTGKMERSLEEAGLSPRLRCAAPDLAAAAAMVEEGLGAAFLPGRWIAARRDKVYPMPEIPAWQARWRALLPPLTDPCLRTGREQLLDRLESWAAERVLDTGFFPEQEKG